MVLAVLSLKFAERFNLVNDIFGELRRLLADLSLHNLASGVITVIGGLQRAKKFDLVRFNNVFTAVCSYRSQLYWFRWPLLLL